ncbi:uncharacterized protein LOC106720599 [Papilio machaon]|uniref:uncharacterized protein LOC106720599 n=1 Tax=Papilio machaon TaxID=76193 RepID=UPI001E664E76|nr:uncharacterized protein LOC106720599 [Papilio machaon]
MNTLRKIEQFIELCLVPKLNKNYDECKNHSEFGIRNKNLDKNFYLLLKQLEAINFKNCNNPESVISQLLILYTELSSKNTWDEANCLKCSEKLNCYFHTFYEINLTDVLFQNSVFNHQEIFDKCFENLHIKLSPAEFKKYPAQIDVYLRLIKDIKRYNVTIVPSKILPTSLNLIDDYIIENKLNGLKSCLAILQCLNKDAFEKGNYYEVVYLSLKKLITEKDIEATKLVFECLLTLYHILPANSQKQKLDEIYNAVLDQLIIESNLYRKAECLKFTKTIISIHKIHCCNRIIFFSIISDNLDLCCNEAVSEVLLEIVLQTLKEWVKYCWCVWKFSTGHKIISNLFKVLYCCKDERLVTEVHNLLVTLIKLCDDTEKKIIINNLEVVDHTIKK